MRNALAGIVCLLSAGALFGQCSQPNLMVSGAQGDMLAPCAGGIAFTSAQLSVSSGGGGTGGGAGQNLPGSLHVVKAPDKASNTLLSDCLNGKLLTITLSDPNSHTTLTFKNATIASFVQNFGNVSTETLDIRYGQMTSATGGSKVVSNVMGTARAMSASIAAVNGDGHSSPVQSFTLTVRPGSTTFNNVQLAPPPPGVASRATMVSGGTGGAAPTESISFNYGKIQVRYGNQSSEFQFSGGQLINGNLRVSRVNFTGPVTVAIHP